MNWRECIRQNEAYGLGSRFDWPTGPDGIDCNPAFTFNDMTGFAGWVWTWPGDYLLSLPSVRTFFDMGMGTAVGSGWSYAFPVALYALVIILGELVGELRFPRSRL